MKDNVMNEVKYTQYSVPVTVKEAALMRAGACAELQAEVDYYLCRVKETEASPLRTTKTVSRPWKDGDDDANLPDYSISMRLVHSVSYGSSWSKCLDKS
jgi:hypothetical protein